MESFIETSQKGDSSKSKPALAPKPCLAPKPFSLKNNNRFRSITAPKPVTAPKPTTKTEQPEAKSVPKTPVTEPAPKPSQEKSAPVPKPHSTSESNNDPPKTTKENKNVTSRVETPDSREAPGTKQTTPAKTAKPLPKEAVTPTNQKAPSNTVTTLEHTDVKNTGDDTKVSTVQKKEDPASRDSSSADTKYTRRGARNRLSMELTSKFESGGLPLPPQPHNITVTEPVKEDNTVCANLEQSQTNAEQPETENNTNELTEEWSGGGSIKRRISLLFDSSSRPEVITKREEPEVIGQINGPGGVKERIKNWVAETAPEKKPLVSARPRSKSFDPTAAPSIEKTPKPSPGAEPTTAETLSSNNTPSRASTSGHSESPPEPAKETIPTVNTLESSLKTPEPQEQNITPQTTTDDKPETEVERRKNAPKRDNVKRRSVRFGVVERNDGGPTIILGSDPSSDEEEASEDESEDNTTAPVPVYRRVGLLQRKDNETEDQEEERLKHLEFEQRRKAEENEERVKLEEEMRQKDVFEKEQREAEVRLREKRKVNEEQVKEKEQLEEDLKEQEWLKGGMNEKNELQKKMESTNKVEKEKKNMEQELERQKEEEQERLRQKLRQEAIERENLRQDEKDRERQKKLEEDKMREQEEQQRRKQQQEKEAEMERVRKIEIERKQEEERIQKEQKELEKKRQTEERIQKEHEELKRKSQEEERIQKEREEELKRKRQEEERIQKEQEELKRKSQEEERIQKEREEQLKRKRQEEERIQKEQEEELKRKRQAEERIQKEREELEKKRQEEERIQKEREEELKRKRQEEARIQKEREELAKKKQEEERILKEREEELKRRRQEDVERNKKEIGLTEGILISFDDEVQAQKTMLPSATAAESRSLMDIDYDDFSVRKPLVEVNFDDFSVRPKRWGSQAKAETNPVQNWAAEPVQIEADVLVPQRLQKVESLVPLDVRPRGKKVTDELKEIFSTEPPLLEENLKEESVDEVEEVEEEEEMEEVEEPVDEKEEEEEEELEKEEEVDNQENYSDDTQEAQVNTQSNEDKDADALIDHKLKTLHKTSTQTPESNSSPVLVPDQPLEVSSDNADTADTLTEEEFAPFPESTTPLLDTSAQRSKADLGRRRSRVRAPRSVQMPKMEHQDWRACDSTDVNETSVEQKQSDSDDEEPKLKIVCSAPSTSQRVSTFPGVNPAALIAQIKKRTGGDRTGEVQATEEVKTQNVKEIPNEELAPSSSQLSRSPRSASHLAGAALVLPPLGGSSGGAVSSPAWLKELKSKKRMSQNDGES